MQTPPKASTSIPLFQSTHLLFPLSSLQKAILTVGDKHRPDGQKHKKEVREGESSCTVHILPLQPSLVCTLGRWQDLMFHQLLSCSLTATACTTVIPAHPVLKNSLQCVVWLLCIFQVTLQTKGKREEIRRAKLGVGSTFPRLFHAPSFVSTFFILLESLYVTWLQPDVYHNPNYTSVVLSHTHREDHLSQLVPVLLPQPIHSFTQHFS